MAKKIFGKKRALELKTREAHAFTLYYADGTGDARHQDFNLVPNLDPASFIGVLRYMDDEPERVAPLMLKLLRKQMDDRDGVVKSSWRPIALPAKEEAEASYRGPDGQIYPFSDAEALAKWKDPANWSSRRRWLQLIEDDDDAVVQLEDITEIAEWAMGLAAERPTQPRA